jgi:hypothetical protein
MTTHQGINEEVTADIKELLKNATCEKAQRGGTELALGHLEHARKLCRKHSGEIPSPVPELVAYRGALTMLRAVDVTPEGLEDISRELLRAFNEESLGPWPGLYRLAVLKRLLNAGKISTEVLSDWYDQVMLRVQWTMPEEGEIHISSHAHAFDDYPGIVQSHLFMDSRDKLL